MGRIPVGQTWTVRSMAHGYAVRDASGTLVGNRTWGGPVHHLYATYADRGGRVFVPEADAIWHQGFTYAAGYLEFNEYSCAARCLERVILPIAFEQYLLGIGEMPSSWPMEALRSQAVAARTYATYSVMHYGLRASCNCNLTDGANDQTYVGYDKVSGPDGNRWAAAVTSTRGQVVSYRGNVIQSFFAASDGGHSENVEDAWHDGNPAYAVAVPQGRLRPGRVRGARQPLDPLELRLQPRHVDQPAGALHGGHRHGAELPGARPRRGRPDPACHGPRVLGTATVTGTELRAALGLPDDRMWVNRDKNILGAIRLAYDSALCHPGLPTTPVSPAGRVAPVVPERRHLPQPRRQPDRVAAGPHRDRVPVRGRRHRHARASHLRPHGRGRGHRPLGVRGQPPHQLRGRHDLLQDRSGRARPVGARPGAYLAHGGGTGSLGFPTTRVTGDGSGTTSASFEHGRITCSGGSCQVT